MQFLQLGNLTIPLQWVLALAALLGGWGMMTWYAKQRHVKPESVETIMNAVFVWGVVWKLSVVLFDFQSVKAQVLSIVYFSGGVKGFIFGAFVSIGYVIREANKQQLWRSLSEALMVFGTAAYGLFLLLNGIVRGEGIFTLISFAAVTLLLLIWLWETDGKSRLPQKAGTAFMIFGLLFHLPGEAPLANIWLSILFPLLSILFYNVSLKKEET